MAKKTVQTNTNRITHNTYLLAALAFIVMGVVFCYKQNAVFDLAMLVFGTILTVLGLFELYYKNLVVGIIETLIGIALIILAVLAADIALIVMGIAVLLYAVYFLVINFDVLKSGSALKKVIIILALLFMAVVAALFIAAYWEKSADLFIALGAFCLGSGVTVALRQIL